MTELDSLLLRFRCLVFINRFSVRYSLVEGCQTGLLGRPRALTFPKLQISKFGVDLRDTGRKAVW